MSREAHALSREWYASLEEQKAQNFINLPIEFQLKGYDYNFIAKSYLNFFKSDKNTRQDKLSLAKKFLRFTRNINKNRAKHELDKDFFECFEYFMENFSDLLAKQDLIHIETLDVITQAIDKSQFVEDIINVDELQRRVTNLEKTKEKEDIINSSWDDFSYEYKQLQENNSRIG